MGIRDLFKKSNFRHLPGEPGRTFLARVAENGMPPLGYAEALRMPVLELCRQVTVLHAEVDELRAEVARLREAQ